MTTLFSLPRELTENIFLRLSYDEICNIRPVCKHFDRVSQDLLNRGFRRAERRVAEYQREIKSQLPRRESERRSHPLTKKCDILAALETRISLLSMTMMKYANQGHCCFIAGRVLDEVFRILRLVRGGAGEPSCAANAAVTGRPHEVLQELRDISSMAMEYFEDHLLPTFTKRRDPDRTSLDIHNLVRFTTQQKERNILPRLDFLHNLLAQPSPSVSSVACCHRGESEELEGVAEMKAHVRRMEARLTQLQRSIVDMKATQRELMTKNTLLEGSTARQAKRIQALECVLVQNSVHRKRSHDHQISSPDTAHHQVTHEDNQRSQATSSSNENATCLHKPSSSIKEECVEVPGTSQSSSGSNQDEVDALRKQATSATSAPLVTKRKRRRCE